MVTTAEGVGACKRGELEDEKPQSELTQSVTHSLPPLAIAPKYEVFSHSQDGLLQRSTSQLRALSRPT